MFACASGHAAVVKQLTDSFWNVLMNTNVEILLFPPIQKTNVFQSLEIHVFLGQNFIEKVF